MVTLERVAPPRLRPVAVAARHLPMIDRRQLSDALARLDPRDREVLDYSLRRHVPDSDLAAVFDCGPSEVARMRAAAIERLANDLGVQRGADLGQVLTALLDNATWKDVPGATPLDVPPTAPVASPTPAASAEPPAPAPAASFASAADPATPPKVDPGERKDPVLGMLSRGVGRPATADATPPPLPAPPARRWSLAAAALIGVLITIGLGSVILLGDDGTNASGGQGDATRPFEPQEEELGEPFPSDPESAYRYPIAILDKTVTLLDQPLGKPKLRVAPKTEWDSPRVLSVVERQGDWLAVLVPELENGEVGWLKESDVERLDTVGWAIKADLRTREIEVERDGEIVKTFKIGIGREDHPTPVGRYAVTDKLSVTDPDSPYGCCVVALTGHQTKLPEGWPGGDRLAIHATGDVSGLGEAVSLGCMRSDPKDARWLMETVPLGTPVFVSESAPPPRPTSQNKPAKR
jgi:L,D-transpeptidase catalytic domain